MEFRILNQGPSNRNILQYRQVIQLLHHIANIYKPPTEHWNNTNLPPVLPHPAVLKKKTEWWLISATLCG